MKKILSLTLAALMVVSAVPMVHAANVDYTQGTAVSYAGTGIEEYTVTVPAELAPGASGTVTLEGTWASDRKVTVTADANVVLTNSINTQDTKTLVVTFAGISKDGDNNVSVSDTEAVSVAAISDALFGTWSGKFNYFVEIANNAAGNVCIDGKYYTVAANYLETNITWQGLYDVAAEYGEMVRCNCGVIEPHISYDEGVDVGEIYCPSCCKKLCYKETGETVRPTDVIRTDTEYTFIFG